MSCRYNGQHFWWSQTVRVLFNACRGGPCVDTKRLFCQTSQTHWSSNVVGCRDSRVQSLRVPQHGKIPVPRTGLEHNKKDGRRGQGRDTRSPHSAKKWHCISKLYAAPAVSDTEQEHFYQHKGHSKNVNVGTYQYPPPVLETTKLGKHLKDISHNKSKIPGVTNTTIIDKVHVVQKSQNRKGKSKTVNRGLDTWPHKLQKYMVTLFDKLLQRPCHKNGQKDLSTNYYYATDIFNDASQPDI